MKFFSLPTAIALLVACAAAQDPTDGFDAFGQPDVDGQIIPAGKPFDITWEATNPLGNISILLMQGPTEQTQNIGDPIVSGLASSKGKFTWNVPTDLTPSGTYGFKLQLDSNVTIFQYSVFFLITGLDGNKTSSSASSSTSSTSLTSSTSSPGSTSTSSSTSSSASAASATSSAKSTSTSSPSSASSPAVAITKPKSSAWIAAAVVGPLAGIAIVAGIILYIRKHRNKLRQQRERGGAIQLRSPEPKKYHEVDGKMAAVEIGAGADENRRKVYEMGGHVPLSELPA